MATIDYKLDEQALAELRTLPGVVAVMEQAGRDWLDAANDTLTEGVGYRMATHTGTSRRGPYAVVRVFTSSNHAKNSNAKHNTLARIAAR